MGAYDKQPGDKLLQSVPHCKEPDSSRPPAKKDPFEERCRSCSECSARLEIMLLDLASPEGEEEELASLLPLGLEAAHRARGIAKREQRVMQELLFDSFLQRNIRSR